MRVIFGLWGPLVLGLAVMGCRFDPMGMSIATDGSGETSSGDQTIPRPADLKIHEALPTLEDTGPQSDLLPPDSTPPDSTQPPDTLPPPDLGPVVDSIPWCSPQNCTGCCEGTTCKKGDENDLCGQGGAACSDCTSQQQVCQASACTNCTQSSQCSGETICLDPGKNGTCVDAYDRKYDVMLVSAKLNKKMGWDSSSWPDPYGKVTVGSNYGYTYDKSNTYDPVWNQYLPDATITKSTLVKVELWDNDDHNSDDYIGKVEISPPVPLSVLRAGEYIFQASSGAILEMKLKFTPP